MSFSNPPKFFKSIQNHELQNGELRVPKAFVQNFWKGTTNPIVLRLPNNVQQEVFWVERNGDIWLQKNWEKLAKFLKYGYVLVFKYIGGACFKVEIFGLNTLEINYDSIKFIDEVVSDDENREENFEVSDENDDNRKAVMDYDATNQNIPSSSSKGGNNKARKCTKRGVTNVAGTSQNRESDTSNNPSFDLTLTQTYAQGYLFRIPSSFSRRYLKDFDGDAMIRVSDKEDRIWKMIVKYDSERQYSIVNSGWKPFREEHNLKIGDVCKFVMIQSEPPSFTITIIRAPEESIPNKLKKGSVEKKQNEFEIVVSSAYPYVPSSVLNSHVDCHGKSAELKVDGESWFVKLYCRNGNRFYAGWTEFKDAFILEIGDTCLLKLIDEKKLVFEVSFERKNQ